MTAGRPPTGLTESLADLLHPPPHRHMISLDAHPAQHLRDPPQAHATVVHQDRHLNDVAIRPLTLEKLNLFNHFNQREKIQLHQLL